MFARKFIEHVDTHADQLCEEFMQKIKRSDRCMGLLHRVPLEEQKQSTREIDRKSTRLNSSHVAISYAVFCLKKKKKKKKNKIKKKKKKQKQKIQLSNN